MWIVFNEEDSIECGWQVKNEKAAIKYCSNHPGFTYGYRYIG